MYLVSIDPGSSDKGWSVWSAPNAELRTASHKTILVEQLHDLIDQICNRAKGEPVAVSLDAPVRVFGGVQAPAAFSPRNVAPGKAKQWPLNVNPFAQRTCEKALKSLPSVGHQSLAAGALAKAIAKLCDWKVDGNHYKGRCFADLHPGVSVLPYMGAPHAPVVRAFLEHLTRRAALDNILISYEPNLQGAKKATIHIVETHPAVTLGFYASLGIKPFPKAIPKYKGDSASEANLKPLGEALTKYIFISHKVKLDVPKSDDELDSLVGLLNLVDLAENKGDIFGTADDGYFLIPACPNVSFAKLWSDAVLAGQQS